MATLLEISADLRALAALFAESDAELAPEQDAALEQWFRELTTDRDQKCDSYIALMKSMEYRASIRKAEIERLKRLVKADERAAKRLKDRLKLFFEIQGLKSIDTDRYHVSLCGNGGKQPMEVIPPAEDLPSRYRRITVEVDRDVLYDDLLAGASVPGCSLKPRGTTLRIR